MLKIIVESPHDAALIEDAVDNWPVRIVNDVERRPGDDDVECLILGSRAPNLVRWVGPLGKIERDWPGVPIIVVTDSEPEVALQLSGIRVSAVVWFEDLRSELGPAIRAARGVDHILRLAGEIEESTLSPSLRSALAHGLRAATDRPVPRVRKLASEVGSSPVTLSQQFRKSVGGRTTLARFLRALVILRAHQLRSSGLGWDRVAGRLRLPRQTLHRQSKEWPGRRLGSLTTISRGQLLARFVSDFVRPLLAERTD
jgi:AraC-like DNA-binding protein